MKKFLTLIFAFALLFTIGCSDSEVDEVNGYSVLVEALESGDANYAGWVNTLAGWIVNYGDIDTGDYFVLDIRQAVHFDEMHIPGAVNSTMAGMFDAVAGHEAEDILVVCYSGQSASYAHTLLRLKGYDAVVLKFGMSIYDASLDKWTVKCSNQYADHANWVTTAAPAAPGYGYPEWMTTESDAAVLLDSRIDAAITAWAGGRLLTAEAVITDPAAYNIINYWGSTDYLGYGHIDGAFQVTPMTLTRDASLSYLDPAGGNVLYCWTGQTAAATIAYLQVLGYDVQSIAYGVNNMIYDELAGHKWPKPWGI